jgi:hypothetical protein
MKIDADLQTQIQQGFAPLNQEAAVHAFPRASALSTALSRANPLGTTTVVPAAQTRAIAKMFVTASVDMWLRAVHSFLISTSLTGVSPIWASVSGYYSSHYTVRSIAHLLGHFQLFSRQKTVRLDYQGGQFVCTFSPKANRDREHRFYWKTVKKSSLFVGDPFFTENPPAPTDESDVAHRDRANYSDHLASFPVFHPLDAATVRTRIERISEIEFEAPPIPKVSRYPDIDSVQVVAYHRLVRFRDLVDAVVGPGNRFWNVHRDPSWARGFIDFQLTEEPSLKAEFLL